MITGTSSEKLDEKTGRKVVTNSRRLTMRELATLLEISRVAIVRRADRENWRFEEVPTNGGMQKLFSVKDLPTDIRKQVRIHFGEIPSELAACIPVEFDAARIQRCTQEWDAARDWQRQTAQARLEVLQCLERYRAQYQGGRRAAVDRFVELFRAKDAPGLDPAIYSRVGRLSRSQLYAWAGAYERDGMAGLLRRHGPNRGEFKIPPEQQEFIMGVWCEHPHLKPERIARSLQSRFNGEAVSANTVGRFMKARKAADPQCFAFLESPDGWRSRYMLGLGSQSQKATHFLHWVEVDSTSADVMCNDNRRYTVLGLIDVFSRKCKFILCPTSNSWGIAALLRATCMDWGIPENLVRDNGQDYASNRTRDGLQALGVGVRCCKPHTPQEKPHVERVFRTLSEDLFETLKGYIGHNVGDRKKIEDRKSFAERICGKGGIELGLSAAELQAVIDGWTEQQYHQRSHSSLRTSPNAMAASVPYRPRRIPDPRALDLLLARPGQQEDTRKVGKKGIIFERGEYWADELIAWIGRTVLIRLDIQDAGRLYCFDPAMPETDAFICSARDMAISGITVGEKIAARKRAAKAVRESAKAMRMKAKAVGDPFTEELNRAKERAKIRNLPVGEAVKGNPWVDGAMAAVAKDDEDHRQDAGPTQDLLFYEEAFCANPPQPVSDDPKVVHLPVIDHSQPHPKKQYFADQLERFRWLVVEQRNRAITDEEYKWIHANRKYWESWVRGFGGTRPECDRLWLGTIAPDLMQKNDIQGGL